MMKPRSYYLVSCIVTAMVITTSSCHDSQNRERAPDPAETHQTVGILYTEPHPVLNTIIETFEEELKSSVPNVVIVKRHAQGNQAEYPAIVRTMLTRDEVDLLVPVTTPMTIEAVRQAGNRVPVLFLGVTDPVGAGVAQSLQQPEISSGVSDNPPMGGVVKLIRRFYPQAKTIGIPYDPKDQPAVVTANRTAEAGREEGFKVEMQPIISESELPAAVRALAGRNDVLVIGMDNLMMKNAGLISRSALAVAKPLFAADDKSVEMGALAGVGVNYAEVGRLGAVMAAQILKGEKKVGELPIAILSTGDEYVNKETAERLGLVLERPNAAQ